VVSRTLRKANVPNILEPSGLSRSDGKRPDGLTLIPFHMGRPLVWDVTVADTLAPSYVGHSAHNQNHCAELAEKNKITKYESLRSDYIFNPLAFETLGGAGPKTRDFVNQICKRLHLATGSTVAGTQFRQYLSLCVQRGNATSVLGTMRQPPSADVLNIGSQLDIM